MEETFFVYPSRELWRKLCEIIDEDCIELERAENEVEDIIYT